MVWPFFRKAPQALSAAAAFSTFRDRDSMIARFPPRSKSLSRQKELFSYPVIFLHRMEQQEAGSEGVLKGNMEERAERLALYIIENRTTVRAAAQKFGVSKSTVHKDISERLPQFNRALYVQVKAVLEENKAQRHIRGGIATRRKYRGI